MLFKNPNTYGDVTGGRVIMQAGNELRLVSGSVNNIANEFEAMKKRNNSPYVTFYTLDNGTFNKGLRTLDKNIS